MPTTPSQGWNAPSLSGWLAQSIQRASMAHFGRPPMSSGVGGSIPFMSLLGERFPEAQFVITGVLGPPMGSFLFSYFISPDRPFNFPGAAFVLAAALTFAALAVIEAYRNSIPHEGVPGGGPRP